MGGSVREIWGCGIDGCSVRDKNVTALLHTLLALPPICHSMPPYTDHQRLSKYSSLYLGPPRSYKPLMVKSALDRNAQQYMRSPPEIYAVTNLQSNPPRSYHMPVERHRQPTLMFDASERFRQSQKRNAMYYQGGGLYHQAIQRQIAELSKLR